MLHDRFRAERLFSRWRIRPCWGEPNYSYFARLVADSEACSAQTFAIRSGHWVGEQRNSRLLQAVLCLPLDEGEKASLRRWTPVEAATSRYWSLADQEISMSHFRPGVRRCPICVKEAAFHRVWWDIKGFERCPVHDVAMERNIAPDGDERWPVYGHCVEKFEGRPILSEQGAHSLEGYIMQRLGALDQVMTCPLLDDEPLSAVVTAVEYLGMLIRNPVLQRIPSASKGDAEAGFQAMRFTSVELEDAFSEWLVANYRRDELGRVGLSHFGITESTHRFTSSLKAKVQLAQLAASARHGLLNGRARHIDGVNAPVLRSVLPRKLGVTVHSANVLLLRLGFDPQLLSGKLVEIPDNVVAKAKLEVDAAVPVTEAAVRLGCTAAEADIIASNLAHRGWTVGIQKRNGKEIERHFLRGELEKMTEILNSLPAAAKHLKVVSVYRRRKLWSATKLMSDVLLGQRPGFTNPEKSGLSGLKVYAAVGGLPTPKGRTRVPDDAMLWSEFNAMIGVHHMGIEFLVQSGHLQRHPGKRSWLVRESALAFCRRFVSPLRCLKGRGMAFSDAVPIVRNMVAVFDQLEVGVKIVERSVFESLAGRVATPPDVALKLYREFVELGSKNCPSFIIPEVPGDGMFAVFPTTRIISFFIVLDDDGFRLECEFRPHFRRIWKTFQTRRESFQWIFESFSVEIGDDVVRIETRASNLEDVDRITKALGRLNEHFRHKMP
ncbi:TniQ family protein [Sinorhizobium sp. B11]